MSSSPTKRHPGKDLPCWKPLDTLGSAQASTLHNANEMVNEREPPRLQPISKPSQSASIEQQKPANRLQEPLQPAHQDRTNQQQSATPKFGESTLLQNPLKKKSPTSVFNAPKPGARRPEHHGNPLYKQPSFSQPLHSRAIERSHEPESILVSSGFPSVATDGTASHVYTSSIGERQPPPFPNQGNLAYKSHQPQSQMLFPQSRGPTIPNGPRQVPDVYEIPKPTNFVPPTRHAAPKPIFSSNTSSFQPVNSFKADRQVVDLTGQDDEDGFDPTRVPGGDERFGAWDPTNFVESAQASENIKALLEGAFEDEDDKPKLRLRKRKKQEKQLESATRRLQALDVNANAEKDSQQEKHEEEDDGSVDGLKVKLLPHQIDGVAWMIDKESGERKKNGVLPHGGILADDMGLGKTIQALSLILSNPRPPKDEQPANPKRKIPEAVGKGTLVVAPLALIKQWESEIKDKIETSQNFKVLVHHGQSRTKSFEALKKYDVVITTYHTLTSEHEASSPDDNGVKAGCFGIHWYRIILDEAHSIKNRNAKMTKAAYDLKSVYRWCMTGTPMQNNLDELQSLIRFLSTLR